MVEESSQRLVTPPTLVAVVALRHSLTTQVITALGAVAAAHHLEHKKNTQTQKAIHESYWSF